MALSDLMHSARPAKVDESEITPEYLREHLDELREVIAYWRMYPDRLVDYYCSLNPDNTFHLHWYQRLMLRGMMRHKNTYMVFCRGYSKSFVGILSLLLKGVLYPGLKMFTVSEGKGQSADIISSKIQELCKFIPALSNEILWDTKGRSEVTRQTKDSVVYAFKNGSSIQNVACSEKSRGLRFQNGFFEEAATLPQAELQSVIIPMLNVPRRVNGEIDPNEKVNQGQSYVTSAGNKMTFAYDKLMEIVCQSVAMPDQAFVLGGDYRVPVKFGEFAKDFIRNLRADPEFNESTFEREYLSHWTGSSEGAFFDGELFDRHRVNKLPEYSPNGRANGRTYYMMGVDVGRYNCTTEICILKVSPSPTGVSTKQLVNIISMEAEHFGLQAIEIKKLFSKYSCKIAVIDGNGLGTGLIDFLITDQIDPDTGETLYNWGVFNDDKGNYRKFKTADTINKAMYIMRADPRLNSEMYSYCQTQLQHGKLKFLVDENTAKADRMNQTSWNKKRPEDRAQELLPYVRTTALREEMLNLVDRGDGNLITLKPVNTRIKHDKFSALIYGLYWCHLQEKSGKRRSRDLSKYLLFS